MVQFSRFTYYPNPVSDEFVVSKENIFDENLIVTIFGMDGRIVYCNSEYRLGNDLNASGLRVGACSLVIWSKDKTKINPQIINLIKLWYKIPLE